MISLEHDLGPPEAGDGYEVAKWTWSVHSANPAGRRNIEAAMNAAERFWNSKS